MERLRIAVAIALMGVAVTACSRSEEATRNGCTQVCAERNAAAVRACRYPETDVATTKQCLQTARQNYDSCKQACGG